MGAKSSGLSVPNRESGLTVLSALLKRSGLGFQVPKVGGKKLFPLFSVEGLQTGTPQATDHLVCPFQAGSRAWRPLSKESGLPSSYPLSLVERLHIGTPQAGSYGLHICETGFIEQCHPLALFGERITDWNPLSIHQPHFLGPKNANEIFLSPHPYLVSYLQTLHSFQPLFYLQWIGF